ncbi:creatininase family protein [Hyphomicrobium sp. CS1GBMeth3]|uniref:creatininase family protein n=1 Tax=Hyphomicrobium sp. CS1GBMeth3 TaxID=1892845 RepID=UPI000AD5C756|nr:creatininase family protein [Hyphomicrobium sp. CS1GBMeth3]
MDQMVKPRRLWWGEMSSADFSSIDRRSTIAVLPIAAIEQHGAHLPLCTDEAIMKGMIETVACMLPPDIDLRVLPIQAIGKSDEHLFAPGTLSLSAIALIENWVALGAQVAQVGIRKLVIVNAHGGNDEVMGIVARELRVRHGLLAAKTSWLRFGHPEGLYSDLELRDGIHGGDVETSLMLHFRPDLVNMALAGDFPSVNAAAEDDYTHLRAVGRHAFAWIAKDLHPSGVVGNAAAATAAKGEASANWQAQSFVELLRDMRSADIDTLLATTDGY